MAETSLRQALLRRFLDVATAAGHGPVKFSFVNGMPNNFGAATTGLLSGDECRELFQQAADQAETIARLTRERDKWLDAFNRSEQFQNGPTKRAEAAEHALTALREQIGKLRETLDRQASDWDNQSASAAGAYEAAAGMVGKLLAEGSAEPGR